MIRRFLAPALALAIGLASGIAIADGTASPAQLCGVDPLWQQALDQAAPAASAPSCADPTQVQIAGGCCEGHGGPAGCDEDTHRVKCADGKKSKSCSC